MNVTVKQIPSDTYEKVRELAEARGRSVNAEIIHILSIHTKEHERRRKLRESRQELDKFVESLPPMESSVDLIREDRNR